MQCASSIFYTITKGLSDVQSGNEVVSKEVGRDLVYGSLRGIVVYRSSHVILFLERQRMPSIRQRKILSYHSNSYWLLHTEAYW